MNKPINFDKTINLNHQIAILPVGSHSMYILLDEHDDTDTTSDLWITDHKYFEETPFTVWVLRLMIDWDKQQITVLRCRKGMGVDGDEIQKIPFITKDAQSWDTFKKFITLRVNELYQLNHFGNN